MPAPISNYEKSQDAAARAFLRYDQSAMIRKFDLSHDADALYITFVDRPHRVDRHTGLVTVVSTGEKADRACRALHGIPQPKGDVAYQLALFPFLPVLLRFWDADEDFPASLQVLLDKNTLNFIHYETLMYALSHLMRRLRQEGHGTAE